MSPIKGREHMLCRPAGFSDDDDNSDDDDDFAWARIRAAKAQTKLRRPNPRAQLEGAIRDGDLEAVQAALEAGASVRDVDSAGYTGLMHACSYGHPHVVRRLVERESQVNVATAGLVTPLMAVCFSSCADEDRLVECARILTAACANLNAVDARGTTALTLACKSGRAALVTALLDAGANVHAADAQGWTALHHCAGAGNAAAAHLLLAAGARKGARDSRGRRAFQIAAARPKLRALAERLCPKRCRAALDAAGDVDLFEFALEEPPLRALLRKMAAVDATLRGRRPLARGDRPNLFEFLTTTDAELAALGVRRSWHRRQTLEFVETHLLLPWERLVQPRLSEFGRAVARWNAERGVAYESAYPTLTYVNAAHLLVGVATRLVILRATAAHFQASVRSSRRSSEASVESRFEVDEVVRQRVAMATLNAGLLESEVGKLARSLRSHDARPIAPADLIVAEAEADKRRGCAWGKVVVVVFGLLAFAAWKTKGCGHWTN